MRELIVAFLSKPSQESYAALRDAFVNSSEFRPEESPDWRIWKLLEEQNFDEAEPLVTGSLNRFLLTSSVHVAFGAIARHRGDEGGREIEFHFATQLRLALLGTGQGTPESPYVVNRVGDEYGILAWLQLTPGQYSTIFHQGKMLDVIATKEQGPVYFDPTIAMQRYTI